jgi:DNA-binding NarL/FixJ family response regulator
VTVVERASTVVRLLGPPGLTLELFRELLANEGFVVVEGGTEDRFEAHVTILVEPQRSHWDEVRDAGVPIVLVVGEASDDEEVVDAVLAGAEAVLHGDSPPDTIAAVLEAVRRGGSVLEPSQIRAVAGVARTASTQPPLSLSKREGEILASIARGDSVKQTARALGISPKTVENIQSRLFRKLGARNRAQAVTRAHELGLL